MLVAAVLVLVLATVEVQASVSCGGHRASTCKDCPEGHGAKWCNGDCRWCYGSNVCHSFSLACPSKAVNGGWSSWGGYGECSAKCGTGYQTRTRQCNNPSPSHGGSPCHGSSTEQKQCKGAGKCTGELDSCYWQNAKYGVTIHCPSDYVAAGACGSGGKGDCGWYIWTKLKCCRIRGGSTAGNCINHQGKWGNSLTCAANRVVTSLCGSGGNGDCGHWIWNKIQCCPFDKGHAVDWSSCKWMYGGYGQTLNCWSGMVVTGACGSGRGRDCPNTSAHGIRCCKFHKV